MALQVWLPLTKDLRNQGLENITVTTSNTNAFQNEGKLGNKSLDVSGHYAFKVPSLVKKRVFSCSFWYKPITNSSLSDNWRRIIVFDTYTSDGSTTGAIFRFESSYGYQSSNTSYCISIHNNVGEPIASIGTSLGYSDGWDKWQHIAITADGTTLKCYRDGVQIASGAMSNGGMLQGIVHIGYSGNRPVGRLNDFRIYDHCLSSMEVKELSKGLVLHYPLSDEYIESTTNLVTTEDGLSNTCYNGATSKYGYGTNTDMYKTLGVFEGRKSTKVYMGTAGLSAYPYVYFDNFNASGTTIQTLSFDYYPTVQDTLIPYSYNGSYNFSYTTDKTSGSASNVGQITVPVEVGRWNHITVTAQKADTTNTSRGIGYIRIGSASHTSTTSNYWLFSNVQVEAKDHATGYAGVGGIRNSNTVYDCSGFCNNGTISGALTISNDTPKYRVSTTINSSKIQCITNPITGDDPIFSIGFWFKLKSNISYIAYADLVSFSSSSYSNQPFRLEICGNPVGNNIYWFRGPSGNTGGFKINTSNLVRDTWYYTMLVSEGNKQYSYYINGIKTGTYNGSANSWIPTNIFSIGDGQAGAFDISDVRIYATALSADDVKSLYQNSAYIDSSGNVYGAVHSEV